MFGLALLIIN